MQRAIVRILLVEDNPGDSRLVDELLSEAASSADFELTHAERLDEALEHLREAEFDVILLDLSLPDSSGLETVNRMQTAASRTPMVVLSGQEDEEVALQALHLGAQDYLIKGQGDGNLMARSIRYAVERRRTDEELRRSEERFRLLVEGVKDYAIFMLDPEGHVVSWNEGAERIKGYEGEEIIGEHLSVFFPEGSREKDPDAHNVSPEEKLRIAATEGRYEEEGLRVRKDGSRFWVEAAITALRDEAGKLRGFSYVTRDITGRKEAEGALRRSPRELADLKFALDESAIVAITDQRGRITYANDKFCELSKYSREELLGQEHYLVPPGHHPEGFPDDWWRTGTRGGVWRGKLEDRAKDGTRYWLDATIVPFLDERGETYRYIAICSDITGRKEAEDALRGLLKKLENL